ncbi:hypothetical protein HDV05_007871, partial [Chytridiales sp. JEL 0842]
MDAQTFPDTSAQILASLTQATSQTQFLGTRDLPFYKTSSKEVSASLHRSGKKLLDLCNRLLAKSSSSIEVEPYENLDDVVDRFDGVVDVVDTLLERVDVCLDEVLGRRKASNTSGLPAQGAPMVVSINPSKLKTTTGSNINIIHAPNISRPQLKFEDKIDNSN